MSHVAPTMTPTVDRRATLERLGAQPLFLWGMANFAVLLAILLLHPVIPVNHVYRLHFISVGLWLVVAWGTNRAPLRIPPPIALLLAISIWVYICTLIANQTIFRFVRVVDNGLYEMPWLVVNFLMGASLAYFAPQARSVVAKWVVGIAVFSSLVAMLQFIGFGPAIRLGALLNLRELAAGVEMEGAGLRAFGVLRIGQSPLLAVVAAMILAVPLIWRKVPWWHIALAAFVIFGALLGQVRNTMPLLGTAYLLLAGLMLYRYGRSRLQVTLLSLAMLLPLIPAVQRMQYVLQLFSDPQAGFGTFTYRREFLWPQVWAIVQERPWTGIGYDPQLYGAGGPTTRRTSGLIVDGGYHLLLGMGGYPALALFVLFLIAAIVTVVIAVRHARGDQHRLPLLVGVLLIVVWLPFISMFGNVAYGQNFTGLLYLVAGLGMTSSPNLAPQFAQMNLLTFARRLRPSSRVAGQPFRPLPRRGG